MDVIPNIQGENMGIVWFNAENKCKDGIATIYESNITLNKNACDLFTNAYAVMLGLDYDEKVLYIKPLAKDVATRGDISKSSQYNITIRASYGRISNVQIVKEIKTLLKISSLKEKPKKFHVEWIKSNETLKIDLNKEVL